MFTRKCTKYIINHWTDFSKTQKVIWCRYSLQLNNIMMITTAYQPKLKQIWLKIYRYTVEVKFRMRVAESSLSHSLNANKSCNNTNNSHLSQHNMISVQNFHKRWQTVFIPSDNTRYMMLLRLKNNDKHTIMTQTLYLVGAKIIAKNFTGQIKFQCKS